MKLAGDFLYALKRKFRLLYCFSNGVLHSIFSRRGLCADVPCYPSLFREEFFQQAYNLYHRINLIEKNAFILFVYFFVYLCIEQELFDRNTPYIIEFATVAKSLPRSSGKAHK